MTNATNQIWLKCQNNSGSVFAANDKKDTTFSK